MFLARIGTPEKNQAMPHESFVHLCVQSAYPMRGMSAAAEQEPQLKLLTPQTVSERTGLSRATLAKWRCTRTNGPAFVKLGAKVAYPEAALNDWLVANLQSMEGTEART